MSRKILTVITTAMMLAFYSSGMAWVAEALDERGPVPSSANSALGDGSTIHTQVVTNGPGNAAPDEPAANATCIPEQAFSANTLQALGAPMLVAQVTCVDPSKFRCGDTCCDKQSQRCCCAGTSCGCASIHDQCP